MRTTWPEWSPLDCGVCGRPGRSGHYVFQDPEEPEEILCVSCARWRQAWLLGLLTAADKVARWGQFRGGADRMVEAHRWGLPL